MVRITTTGEIKTINAQKISIIKLIKKIVIYILMLTKFISFLHNKNQASFSNTLMINQSLNSSRACLASFIFQIKNWILKGTLETNFTISSKWFMEWTFNYIGIINKLIKINLFSFYSSVNIVGSFQIEIIILSLVHTKAEYCRTNEC